MALDHPEDEVSPLWQVAIADGKYRECPYLQSNRQGQCVRFRNFGPTACFHCGFIDGLDAGYDMGNEDGYRQGVIDAEPFGEEERWEEMD